MVNPKEEYEFIVNSIFENQDVDDIYLHPNLTDFNPPLKKDCKNANNPVSRASGGQIRGEKLPEHNS